MKKVAVVFGGAGFIGGHLLKMLSSTGEYAQLLAADIAEPRQRVDGVTYLHVDVREVIDHPLLTAATEIYNFAAVHASPGHEVWEYYWTNVLGAVHVCDFARRAGVKRLLFTSSIAVYGSSEDVRDERSALNAESAYGRSKICAEEIHRLWQSEAEDERKLTIVRPAVIYGNGTRSNFLQLARYLKSGRFVYPGRRDAIKSSGYVKDLVRSMRFMMDANRTQTTYL